MTDAEQTLWQQLRAKRLKGWKFRRQVPIGHYIVDFVCIEARLIIEVDGGQHAKQAGYDARRTTFLEGEGFQLLRYWNSDVLTNIDGVLMDIVRHLED